MRAGRLHIHRVERLAGGHEQPIPSRTPEADIRARFRQPDHADPIAIRREHLYAGPRTGPDVAVGIAPDAVGR